MVNLTLKALTTHEEILSAFCDKLESGEAEMRLYVKQLIDNGNHFFQFLDSSGKVHAQFAICTEGESPKLGLINAMDIQSQDFASIRMLIVSLIAGLEIDQLVTQSPLSPAGMDANKMRVLGFYPQYSIWHFPVSERFGAVNPDVNVELNYSPEGEMLEEIHRIFKGTDAEEEVEERLLWKLTTNDGLCLFGILTDTPNVINNLTVIDPTTLAVNNGHHVALMMSAVMARVPLTHPFNVVIPAVNTDYVVNFEKFPVQLMTTEFEFKGVF